MPYCQPGRKDGDSGWVINCAERFVQQGFAADALQPTLRCGFQARLKPSVRLPPQHGRRKM